MSVLGVESWDETCGALFARRALVGVVANTLVVYDLSYCIWIAYYLVLLLRWLDTISGFNGNRLEFILSEYEFETSLSIDILELHIIHVKEQ